MSRRPAEVDPRRLQGKPRVRWVQKVYDQADAEDAIFLASQYRLVPDPWQCDVVHAWMGRRRTGKWVHPRNGLSVPRQNGKNAAVEVRELFGLIELHEAILHTAQLVKTSKKAFKRLKTFFGEEADDPDAKFPELNALVAEVRNTNGQEAIYLKDVWLVDGQVVRSVGRPPGSDVEFLARGGFIDFATRSGRGGRGETYDLLIIDEAQHLSEEQLEALRPVISSGALGNSQIIYLGTPPDPEKLTEKVGDAWVRIRSRAGKAKDLAWIEFGAPDGPMPDLDDKTLLYASNPSLEVRHANGSFGLSMETVDGERDELSPAGYARERLGWWGNPDVKRGGVIDMNQWRTLRTTAGRPVRGQIVVDVSPNLEWTTVAVASDGPEGRTLVLVDRAEGTGWVVDTVQKLHEELAEVVELALTPTAQIFAAALTKLKLDFHQLTSAEVGRGCTAFQESVRGGRIAHVGQTELDDAVRDAVTRYVGDTQHWDRRNRSIDLSPLVATSVAAQRWQMHNAKPKTPPPAPVRAAPRQSRASDVAHMGF